ncbi:response regulator [uncultured Gimesia sp.]|uniref:response regulator n=1 Tax=uncultured Gimesia sp. TaxID=1678688 RepID=UPI0030DCE233|tara:strand:+ start:20668 stop:21879 length:1212 start_codon:yes stop_codon:yes gene_type:complete
MCLPRILFVDDEPNVLDGIRRMLHRKRKEWEIHFAPSAAEALLLFEQAPFDVVVSDMRMPQMDGAELLNRIAASYPDTVRMILSGQSDKEAILRAIPVTHQYISKPCDANILQNQIHRSICLRKRVDHKLVRRAVSQITRLPSLPDLYQKICDIARSENAGIKDAIDVIQQDAAMSAKVLQLVNSSYFGIAREISSISQAISLLGMETLKSLVLSIGIFDDHPPVNLADFSLKKLMNHSVACGTLAKKIAYSETGDSDLAEHAFTAGLLHDLGKLLLATELPKLVIKTIKVTKTDMITFSEAELLSEGFSHADVSGYLIGLWKLPMPVVEAVTFHHSPQMLLSETLTPALAVYAANIIVQEQTPGESGNPIVPTFDQDLIEKLELTTKIDQWRQLSPVEETVS